MSRRKSTATLSSGACSFSNRLPLSPASRGYWFVSSRGRDRVPTPAFGAVAPRSNSPRQLRRLLCSGSQSHDADQTPYPSGHISLPRNVFNTQLEIIYVIGNYCSNEFRVTSVSCAVGASVRVVIEDALVHEKAQFVSPIVKAA